ncbi:unnamed protein product, partial [Rotaria sp. Silwood1]
APPRPRDIIIERWIPYGPAPKRQTVVQRAASARGYPAPRNVIIQYEQAPVRVVRQFVRLGVTQESPALYVQRYGAALLDAQSLLAQARAAGVVEDISPPAGAVVGYTASSFGSDASLLAGGGAGGAEFVNVAGGDLGGASSSFSSSTFESSAAGGLGGLVGGGLEATYVGGAGAGLAGGAGLGVAGGLGGGYSSSYESSYLSGAGGAEGYGVGLGVGGVGLGVGGAGLGVGGTGAGFDAAAASFNSADINKDGRLDAGEFQKFVQGGL